MSKPNIIVWDLETLPNLPEVMKVLPRLSDFPGRTLKSNINSIICFGYKTLGEKKAHCISAWDFPKRWKKDINDDYDVVKAAWGILHKADAIITHNGARFDYKVINSRFLYHGFSPLPKILHIDTCRIAKSRLFLVSNSLNNVADFLGCGQKLANGGWDLWVKVSNRDKASMKLMVKYCKQDVNLTEEVFEQLKPLATNIPNYSLFSDSGEIQCPSCGSEDYFSNGTRVTKTKVQQRKRCKVCGTNFSIDKKEVSVRVP